MLHKHSYGFETIGSTTYIRNYKQEFGLHI